MKNLFCSLGLMSGTSGDGIDASVIQSDGNTQYKVIYNRYFKYNANIHEKIYKLKNEINNLKDLEGFSSELDMLEDEITKFHGIKVNEILKDLKVNIDLVGFHGQTIFHDAQKKITKQLGNGKLLSEILNKTVVYNFRQNDLKNGGQGAPLAPIFHKILVDQNKIGLPVFIINIGGITNLTILYDKKSIFAQDIGPGNCLIDQWIKKNKAGDYDIDGKIASSGEVKEFIFENTYLKKRSLGIHDFDINFADGLSLEDGAATITYYTAEILKASLEKFLLNFKNKNLNNQLKIIICGGGRKNHFLVDQLKKKINYNLFSIDEFGIDGDFIESQAFAYLAIRSYLKLPISFPETTGVKKALSGGEIILNSKKQ